MDEAAVVLLDEAGVIRFWGDGAEALFGHAAGDVVGTLLETLVPPDYRSRHRQGFAAAIERGDTRLQVPGGPVAYLPLLCADGQFRRFPGRQVVVRDPNGAVVAVAGVFTATYTAAAFIPSLYPVDGEIGEGDLVVG